MMKLLAQTATIWSAVTRHRFARFGDSSPKQGRVQQPTRYPRVFDGDKSPAESADKSAHSKTGGRNTVRVWKSALSFPVWIALVFLGATMGRPLAAETEGVALAILFDNSGSMKDSVRDSNGKPAAKYKIACRALEAIADHIQTFSTNTTAGKPLPVEAGLFVFANEGARMAIPFGPFNADAFRSWARSFSNPQTGTPLGNALTPACRAVLNSPMTRKHVLVITDGENTVGPKPTDTLPGLLKEAGRKQTSLSIHFVAFDVDAKVFNGVKKLGATVVSAANEAQLNTQLDFIIQTQILLEEEAPAKKP